MAWWAYEAWSEAKRSNTLAEEANVLSGKANDLAALANFMAFRDDCRSRYGDTESLVDPECAKVLNVTLALPGWNPVMLEPRSIPAHSRLSCHWVATDEYDNGSAEPIATDYESFLHVNRTEDDVCTLDLPTDVFFSSYGPIILLAMVVLLGLLYHLARARAPFDERHRHSPQELARFDDTHYQISAGNPELFGSGQMLSNYKHGSSSSLSSTQAICRPRWSECSCPFSPDTEPSDNSVRMLPERLTRRPSLPSNRLRLDAIPVYQSESSWEPVFWFAGLILGGDRNTSELHTGGLVTRAKQESELRICGYCGVLRNTSDDLDRHLKFAHGGNLGPGDWIWQCKVPNCNFSGKIWPCIDEFKSHIRRMHNWIDAYTAESMCVEYDPELHGLFPYLRRPRSAMHVHATQHFGATSPPQVEDKPFWNSEGIRGMSFKADADFTDEALAFAGTNHLGACPEPRNTITDDLAWEHDLDASPERQKSTTTSHVSALDVKGIRYRKANLASTSTSESF
ncbi:hypothetical protein OHC33_008097 [Knufia fluminis]|uniref:Uncharacterized protein n=1 Tax=Knufia fluminis TaxID=191047 RepID=A0AAN8EJ25_9EURO|nr:hypothetical protein OHC33_008097 [Knufia fluminis]